MFHRDHEFVAPAAAYAVWCSGWSFQVMGATFDGGLNQHFFSFPELTYCVGPTRGNGYE